MYSCLTFTDTFTSAVNWRYPLLVLSSVKTLGTFFERVQMGIIKLPDPKDAAVSIQIQFHAKPKSVT